MTLFPRQSFVIAWYLLLGMTLLQCQSHRYPAEQDLPKSWEEHQQRMLELKEWHISGKIGITYPEGGTRKGITARFDWQQQESDFVMAMTGPMGAGRFTLEKKANRTVATNAKGETFRATSPEALFRRHGGLYLPVTDLVWWVRGIPEPEKMHQKTFAGETFPNQLATLEQSSWTIEYLDYQRKGGDLLPQKIKLGDGEINVTLIISEWSLGSSLEGKNIK